MAVFHVPFTIHHHGPPQKRHTFPLNFSLPWAVYSYERTEKPMYFETDISSNAEALVALLLVCAIAVMAFV